MVGYVIGCEAFGKVKYVRYTDDYTLVDFVDDAESATCFNDKNIDNEYNNIVKIVSNGFYNIQRVFIHRLVYVHEFVRETYIG